MCNQFLFRFTRHWSLFADHCCSQFMHECNFLEFPCDSTWRAAPLKSAMRVLMAPIGGGPACGVLYAFLCQANEAMENLQQYWNRLFTHQVEPSNLRVRRVEAGQVRPHHRIRRCSGLCHFFSHVPDALIFTCSSCPLVKPNLWCCAWCLGWSNVMICSLLLRPPLFSYIGAVTRSQKIRILRCVAIFFVHSEICHSLLFVNWLLYPSIVDIKPES